MKKVFFQNMCLFTLVAVLLLLGNGCAAYRAVDDWAESFRPSEPVHHASSVYYTGARPVIIANTGKATRPRNLTLIFEVRKYRADPKQILHRITLEPNESFQLWLREGAYTVDVRARSTNKRVGGKKKLLVPDQGRPYRFYSRRYAAGVVF